MNAFQMLGAGLDAVMRKLGLGAWRTAFAPRGLEAEVAAEIELNLVRLFEEQQLYLEPNLTVRQVAARLGVASRFVSHVIATRLNENFPGFVNRKRAEAAARALHGQDRANFTRIMLQSGFGSKAAFQKEFKRCFGVTPIEYRRAFLESQVQDPKVFDPGQRSSQDVSKPSPN